MPALSVVTTQSVPLKKPRKANREPKPQLLALIVSPDLEVRRALLCALEKLAADCLVCTSRMQAEEVLRQRNVKIVFCDEQLADGSYLDFIHTGYYEGRIPRVGVATRTVEWSRSFEAMASGAFDVIRFPWHATDVELAVIRVQREEQRACFAAFE